MIKLFLGGYRSGKTTGGVIDVVLEMIGKHPLQLAGKRPMPPIYCRAITIDHSTITKVLVPEYEHWIPKAFYDHYDSKHRVMHLTNGSKIDFLSYEQEPITFGAAKRSIIHFDEEPPQDIYDRCLPRLVGPAGGGRFIITETPEYGMTWIFDEVWLKGIDGRPCQHDYYAVKASIDDNPYITQDEKDRAIDKITDEDLKRVARYGDWIEFAGLVWREFDIQTHTCERFDLEWVTDEGEKVQPTRYMAIDPMDREIAALWIAVYPTGRVVVYNELLMEDATPDRIAAEIKARDGGKIAVRYMDWNAWATDPTSGKTFAREMARQKVSCRRATKDWILGKSVVKEYFKARDPNKHPIILIFKDCVHTIKQLSHYVYDRSIRYERDHNAKNTPRKKEDHFCDCLRYLLANRPLYRRGVYQTVKSPISGKILRVGPHKNPVTGWIRSI